MSLIPINLDRYRDWTIEQLYYLLFPYIKKDFMGRKDCKMVHQSGNMTVTISGATGSVEHTTAQGGHSIRLAIKEAQYRSRQQEGRAVLSIAKETGVFRG